MQIMFKFDEVEAGVKAADLLSNLTKIDPKYSWLSKEVRSFATLDKDNVDYIENIQDL